MIFIKNPVQPKVNKIYILLLYCIKNLPPSLDKYLRGLCLRNIFYCDQLTRCRVDGINEVVEFDVNGRSLRLVRQRLHVNPGRDPGDGPVGGHTEHPGPGRFDQRHLFLVRRQHIAGTAGGRVVVVVVLVVAAVTAVFPVAVVFPVAAVVDRRRRERDGALRATHRGPRLFVAGGHGCDHGTNSFG